MVAAILVNIMITFGLNGTDMHSTKKRLEKDLHIPAICSFNKISIIVLGAHQYKKCYIHIQKNCLHSVNI